MEGEQAAAQPGGQTADNSSEDPDKSDQATRPRRFIGRRRAELQQAKAGAEGSEGALVQVGQKSKAKILNNIPGGTPRHDHGCTMPSPNVTPCIL